MKKILLTSAGIAALAIVANAQPCATTMAVGSASNAFTNIENSTNCVAIDNNLNTVIFIHRNNASTFGGHSGQLRYDLSTDNGASWTSNAGVVNPLSVNGTNGARYPQIAIYNPVGNTVPANAYLSYLASTTAATFNGLVSGVRQLNGTGNTETYNQPANAQTLIPASMCKGANGIEWAIDAIFNGTNVTGYRVYKGTWNGSNDFVWTTNSTITPTFNTAYSGTPYVADASIAFDPTGQYGWICLLTHITPGPAAYSFYPVFYRTTDGGTTWSAPMQVDLSQFSCISSNITAGNYATCAFEGDLVVDVNGDPHFFTTVCNGNNAYAVFYTSWHHMFDITWHNGMFNALDVANVNAGRGTWGTAPNAVTMDNQPMASRTDDGTKVFFGWCDNSTYTLGQANQTPNLFSRAYDVVTQNWTNVRDFTSCNAGINGQIMVPKLAAEVLEPSAGVYRLPVIRTTFTSNDPILVANFTYLDNLEWTNADFTIPQPTASVAVDQGTTWLLCPGSTLGLSVTGAYDEYLWSDGATSAATTINAPGTYTVMVRQGCTLGMASIVVTGLTSVATASQTSFCPGDSSLLTVTGNALSYVWQPGNVSNDSLMAIPVTSTNYTVIATGDGGCTYTQLVSLTVHPPADVIASATAATICDGDQTTISASGTSTYSWMPIMMTGPSHTVSPSANTTYTVTGTDGNGCVDVDSVSIVVNMRPTISTSVTLNAVCMGDSTQLSVTGTASYVWLPGSLTDSVIMVAPASATTYTVTGTSGNGCTDIDSISIAVNPLPSVTLTSPLSIACFDDGSIALSGSGSPIGGIFSGTGVTDSSFIPANAGIGMHIITYMYSDANGCSASAIDSIMVDPCLGVTDNSEAVFSVYPNPFDNQITIVLHAETNAVVTVHSIAGQTITSTQMNGPQFVLNSSEWSAGVYFITIANKDATETMRVVKH